MTDYMSMVKPAIVLAVLTASRYMDEKDPSTIFYIRATFVTSFAFSWLILALIYGRIQQRHDNTPFQLLESDIDPSASSPLAMLTGDSEQGKTVTSTHYEYDMTKLQSALKQSVMGFFIVLTLHWYMGSISPLVVQSVMAVSGSATSELAKLHLWTMLSSSVGGWKELQRPWRVKGLMSQFKEMKREVMKELNDGKEGTAAGGGSGSRKNKRDENRRKIGKSS